MKEIMLTVTIDEANLILEALGDLPFARVYKLIAKLQEQAGQQLNTNSTNPEANSDKNTASGEQHG